MPTLRDIHAVIERLWPAQGAEPWDASGLISGADDQPVERIHLAVDAVPDTAVEAVQRGADLLITHHPLLLRGVTTVAESTVKGRVIGTLIRGGCALLAAHTNADVVASGTSAVLAHRLGLSGLAALETRPGDRDEQGIGRVGSLPEPIARGLLARRLVDILPATASGARVAGSWDRPVQRVALCAGAGDSLMRNPAVLASDVYITSDLRHHPASDFREQSELTGGPALIDISHWAAEWLWLEVAAQELREATGLPVTVSDLRTDPWDFAVLPATTAADE